MPIEWYSTQRKKNVINRLPISMCMFLSATQSSRGNYPDAIEQPTSVKLPADGRAASRWDLSVRVSRKGCQEIGRVENEHCKCAR